MKTNKYIGQIASLGSSSRGNAFFIEILLDNAEPFGLLIECGFSLQQLILRLGEQQLSLNDIDAVLITHEHQDHARSIKELLTLQKPIYAPQSVFNHFGLEPLSDKHIFTKEYVNKVIHRVGNNTIKVFGFPLEHYNDKDTKINNFGYVITINDDYKIFFAIDTKYIKQKFPNQKFNMIFIETNYANTSLRPAFHEAKKKGNINKAIHYNRVFNSHMAVEVATKTLLNNFDLTETEVIIQTHLTSSLKAHRPYFNTYFKDRLPRNIEIWTTYENGGFMK